MSLQTDPVETGLDRVEPADAPSEVPEVHEIEPAPSRLTQLTAVGLAALAPLGFSIYGLGLGLAGAVLLAVGVIRSDRRFIHGGGVFLLGGSCIAAIQGAEPNTVLLATLLSIVAWDVGKHGIVVGEQLGRAAETTRIEVAHTVWSVAVGLVAILILDGLFLVVVTRSPVSMWVLLVGVVLLVGGFLVERPRSLSHAEGSPWPALEKQ